MSFGYTAYGRLVSASENKKVLPMHEDNASDRDVVLGILLDRKKVICPCARVSTPSRRVCCNWGFSPHEFPPPTHTQREIESVCVSLLAAVVFSLQKQCFVRFFLGGVEQGTLSTAAAPASTPLCLCVTLASTSQRAMLNKRPQHIPQELAEKRESGMERKKGNRKADTKQAVRETWGDKKAHTLVSAVLLPS